jgi:SAM-dependent methyltransferase
MERKMVSIRRHGVEDDSLTQAGTLYRSYRKLRSDIRTLLFGKYIYLDRVVLYQETERMIAPLPASTMDALEISGDRWATHGFRSYVSANYPEYDVCAGPLSNTFDIIIAEQVFEHLLWPHRAAKNVFSMLRPGGYFFLATPFLLRVHEIPFDCSRWTETGLKYLLADSGFRLENIKTGSWGNLAAVKRNLHRKNFPAYFRHINSLENDKVFPVQVWALARKTD